MMWVKAHKFRILIASLPYLLDFPPI